ncbi:MAG: methyltransferase domain-containing protein [Dehalococcoidia bacterium]|nr:MAG: methyltransferase domain-containing protein [Dehalococcoidia bacterium]
MADQAPSFSGPGPEAYHHGLCPTMFEPYARDLAARMPASTGMRVLETAAGTGVVTRALLKHLPADARLVATDISEDMLAIGRSEVPADPRLEWRQADAQALAFPDASFDVVVCQFGVMFFPDKALAMREARRVLKPGGTLLLNTWDSLDRNPFARITNETLAMLFPHDPPTFFHMPFSYSDRTAIRALLETTGFAEVEVRRVEQAAECASVDLFARGLVYGTPIYGEVQARGTIDAATVATRLGERLTELGGASPHRSPMSAMVTTARV